jgi:alpha-ketoglutarate-dependent taurine dioxygenase
LKRVLAVDLPTVDVAATGGDAMMFRQLSPAEEARFRAWSRNNYEPGSPILGIWHPVIQEECTLINRERALFVPEPLAGV